MTAPMTGSIPPSRTLPTARLARPRGAGAASRMFFRRSPLSAFWGCIAAAIIVMAIAAPVIAPYEPLKSDFRAMHEAARAKSTGSAPTRSAATC